MLDSFDLAGMAQHLPNGLHDAEIESFSYNVLERRVCFSLTVWIGLLDIEEQKELYRQGILTFEGVQFFTKTESDYLSDDQLTLLDWTLAEDLEEKAKLPTTFQGKFFYLAACYCQFRIGCKDVFFSWRDSSIEVRN